MNQMKNKLQYTILLMLLLWVTASKVYAQYPLSNRLFFQNKFGINVRMKCCFLGIVLFIYFSKFSLSPQRSKIYESSKE